MLFHQVCRSIHVTFFHRVQNFRSFHGGDFDDIRVLIRHRPNQLNLPAQLVQHGDERGVSRELGDGFVELLIRQTVRVQVACLKRGINLPQYCPQVRDCVLSQIGHGNPHRHRFQPFPYLIEVKDFLRCERSNKVAAIRPVFDEAVLNQPGDRLAQWRATDPQLIRNELFIQADTSR